MQDCTDLEGLNECMGKQIVTAYAGFDCTGPSLHVGHLMSIMILRRLQKNGHKASVF